MRYTGLCLAALALAAAVEPAFAQRRGGGGMRGGGGGHVSRGGARPSVTRPNVARDVRPTPTPRNVDRANINRPDRTINRDINVDRNVNINRPVNIHDQDFIEGRTRWDGNNGCCYHPVARGAAYVAGAAVGAAAASAAIGSTVYALPVGCSTTVVNGVTYQQCGSTWYEPQFVGDDAVYIVVSPP